MNQLTTVFEITSGTNGVRADALLRLAIGLVVLIAGIIGLIRPKHAEGPSLKRWYGPAFMTGWGVFWLIIHIPLWRIGTSDIDRLVDIYHHGKSQIAEG